MRHRRRWRHLGRTPSHKKAMLKNLASSLILTERDSEGEQNAPKVKGRVVTTLQKAKEVRVLVEKAVTLARKSLAHEEAAREFETSAERGSAEWKAWRESEQWQKWANARSPVVAAQRRALQMLGDRYAVSILFHEIAPRFKDRDGGYTRILKLAQPRLGDAGAQAIIEFVGQNDRVTSTSAARPSFSDDDGGVATDEAPVEDVADETPINEAPTDDVAADEATADEPEASADDSEESKEE